MSYPGENLAVAALWYRLLNCGFRLAATAGTDTFMNTADNGEFSNPPAGDRVYVRVEGEFTTESWCDGVRRGRTFVTDGPMLSLEVNGAHGIGDEIAAKQGDMCTSRPPQVIRADEPHRTDRGRRNRRERGRDRCWNDCRALARLIIMGPCWVALRALGPGSENVLDPDEDADGHAGAVFAHTKPGVRHRRRRGDVVTGGCRVFRRMD